MTVLSVYLRCQVQLLYRRLILAGEIQHMAEQEVSIAVRRGASYVVGKRCQVLIKIRAVAVKISWVHASSIDVCHTIHPAAYCVTRVAKITSCKMRRAEVKLGYTVLRRGQDGLQECVYGKTILSLFEIALPGGQAAISLLVRVTTALILPAVSVN